MMTQRLFILAMALTLAACGASPVDTTVSPSTTVSTTPPISNASQSPEDASRDGVIAAVAALRFEDRVDIQSSIETAEGTWVISRIGPGGQAAAVDCRLGAEDGEYPIDFICTYEYAEILLIEDGRIIRAYPLPGAPAELLVATNEAMFCARNGEGMLPDSMVCRIDRETLESIVRIFPGEVDSVVAQPCFYPPDNWTIDEEPLVVTGLIVDERGVWVQGVDGPALLDANTLEPVSDIAGIRSDTLACTTTFRHS